MQCERDLKHGLKIPVIFVSGGEREIRTLDRL